MQTDTSRSNRIAFAVAFLLVPFAVGLTLALSRHPSGQAVTKVVGALGMVTGLYLLTSRHLFQPRVGAATREQLEAARKAAVQLRLIGATGLLMGVSLLVPDTWPRAVLMLSAAAVSMSAAFKVPRRLFRL
jgi:hypothetical protein